MASELALRYARMDDVEKCYFMGTMRRRIWYARIYQPDRVDELKAAGHGVAHEPQIPAWLVGDHGVRTHIWSAGRGSGKSRAISEYIITDALSRPELRVAVLAPTFRESVGTNMVGKSGIRTVLAELDPALEYKWDEIKHELTLVNGSKIFCYSSEKAASMRGPEFHVAWVDEVADLYRPMVAYRKILEPAVRLGDEKYPSRMLVTGTPAATELVRDLYEKAQSDPEMYRWTQMATRDNIENLDRATVNQLYRESDGTDFQRAELEGELLLEAPDAMLSELDLARIRCEDTDPRIVHPRSMEKVVLGLDPSRSDDRKSDETGMVLVGYDGQIAHVIGDASGRMGPLAWGERVVEIIEEYAPSHIVLEDDKSLAKELLEKVLDEHLGRIRRMPKIVMAKHGNRSKKTRMEPVVALYQAQRVLHHGHGSYDDLSKLEWQWKSWSPNKTGKDARSPDRVDAAVYAITWLMLRDAGPETFFRAGGSFS